MSTNKRLMDLGDQKSRVLSVPVIVGGLLLCLMGSMFLHGWSQNNSFVPAIQVLLGTAEGGAAGEVISQGDITLYIPPNATDQAGTFSIAAASPDVSLISNDTEWIRPKVVNVEFWQPNGVQVSNISFSEPVEICFGMGEEQWQAFLSQPEAFEVQHYLDKQDTPVWEVLPQITYPERLQLCGQTYELSAFALAIRVEAEVPVTGATSTATLVPTRTPVSPFQTYERNRDGASSESGLLGGASNPTPTRTSAPGSTLAPAATNTVPPTNAPTLGPTNTPGPTSTPRPTNTRRPTRTPTPRPSMTPTDDPTNTPRPPTSTPTEPPATNTPRPPTATPRPPTATNEPPTATDEPPTATDEPPTATNEPPPDTPEPPPDTPEPPPDTPEPTPGS